MRDSELCSHHKLSAFQGLTPAWVAPDVPNTMSPAKVWQRLVFSSLQNRALVTTKSPAGFLCIFVMIYR